MKIDRSGANVTVRVDNAELSELGLNFDSLKERDISARIFLAALRAQIMNRYGADIGGDIRVVRCDDGVLFELTLSLSARFFNVSELSLGTDADGDIYILDGTLVIVPDGCDEVISAKIKEHGRFVCHTPRDNIQM
jgi:hypothetical protein